MADWYQIAVLEERLPTSEPSKPECGIPNDVKFKVIDEDSNEDVIDNNDYEISAQKYRLALSSRVFAVIFFRPFFKFSRCPCY